MRKKLNCGLAPLHPAEVILDDCMDAQGLDAKTLSLEIDYPLHALERFLKQQEPVTEELARKFESLGWGSKELWLRLQSRYDRKMSDGE